MCLGRVALRDSHPLRHAVREAENKLDISSDILPRDGAPVGVSLTRMAENTKDVGAEVLRGVMGAAVVVEEPNMLVWIVTDRAGMLHAATDELVVRVDDTGHGDVGLGSALDENLDGGQRILCFVVFLPACIQQELVSLEHAV